MYFTDLSKKNFKLYKISFLTVLFCKSVSDVGLLSLLLRLWVAVYRWVMSGYVYFAVSWGWCGIKWSHALTGRWYSLVKLPFCSYSCVLNGRISFRQICKMHFMRQFYVPQPCICTSHHLDKRLN
jgi:hypothetical protein